MSVLFHADVDGSAHYKLEKSSMEFMTPYDRVTMIHELVKARFFQNALGIRAGFCCFSR